MTSVDPNGNRDGQPHPDEYPWLVGRPATFGPEFLAWVRSLTEEGWATWVPRDPFKGGGAGLDWVAGTHWRGGMSESEIEIAERRFGLVFPPDYRLLLTTLHTTDPAMVGARYEGDSLVPALGRTLWDWQGDPTLIEEALAWPLDGLLWSIEAGGSWCTRWGPRPASRERREEQVRALVANGPRLIPITGHRYLVAEPFVSGNPVLSMYGSDVIEYADDLGAFLANLAGGVARPKSARYIPLGPTRSGADIPFWGDVIGGEWTRSEGHSR